MTDMNAEEFLFRLDQIPHLLDLARQQDALQCYQVQKTLRQQRRQEKRPFLYSMPMRHLYHCPLCGKRDTDILHELEDPRRNAQIKFLELVIHQARDHDTPPDDELAAFVDACLKEAG
ncbi:MAG: hypothetical protein FD146_2416 [Anaerolineaceae bacterium]|nr:MAG: hypothetical protein FD146_2416 [Anaerolineaceae bacterium]